MPSSACATSAHCIGHGADLIKSGQQDIVIAGGGEDEHWSSSSLFDAVGALSSNFNDDPKKASRPYDKNRDGFVISGGSGILILEEEDHAKKSSANILANFQDTLLLLMAMTWLHLQEKELLDVRKEPLKVMVQM